MTKGSLRSPYAATCGSMLSINTRLPLFWMASDLRSRALTWGYTLVPRVLHTTPCVVYASLLDMCPASLYTECMITLSQAQAAIISRLSLLSVNSLSIELFSTPKGYRVAVTLHEVPGVLLVDVHGGTEYQGRHVRLEVLDSPVFSEFELTTRLHIATNHDQRPVLSQI